MGSKVQVLTAGMTLLAAACGGRSLRPVDAAVAGAGGNAGIGSAAGTAGQGSDTPGNAGFIATDSATVDAPEDASTSSAGVAGSTAGAPGHSGLTDAAEVYVNPYQCTLVAGTLETAEWYNAGFESGIADGANWEGKFQHYGYVDIWAQAPPAGFAWSAPLTSACTKGADAPDRVIFTAWSWELQPTEDVYVSTTVAAIEQFIQHFPSMKRMDLLTIVRCPGDRMCNPGAAVPPIQGQTDHNAGQQDCYVPPSVDNALKRVAAMFADLVFVGPKFESPACPIIGSHLYDSQVAKTIAGYYNTSP